MTRAPDPPREQPLQRSSGPPRPPSPGQPIGLGPAVHAALASLVDLTQLPAMVTDGRVETMLRGCLDGRDGNSPSAAAVRAACAHLAAGEYEDCYLALRTALDHLPHRATAEQRDRNHPEQAHRPRAR